MHTLPKTALRSLYKTVRSHIGPVYAAKTAEAIIPRFLKAVPLTEGQVIAGYAAIQHELDVLPLLEKLTGMGHNCALPVMGQENEPLLFRQWSSTTPLTLNERQIAEPEITAPLLIPDIILLPLIACDKTGNRLGYGKGFYDRTLAALRAANPQLLAVGMCFHVQIAEEKLPAEEHDQKLDMIVTEKGPVDCRT